MNLCLNFIISWSHYRETFSTSRFSDIQRRLIKNLVVIKLYGVF